MKPVLRDILVIALICAAIAGAPFIVDALDSGGGDAPKETSAPLSAEAGKSAEPARSSSAPAPAPAHESTCPGALGHLHEYQADIDGGHGDRVIVGGTDPSQNVVPGVVDAGGGIDTLEINGPGIAAMDGLHLLSVERIQMRNNQPNVIKVHAGGLESLDGAHAEIIGDADIDTVFLDDCLQWNDPIIVHAGAETFMEYDTYDEAGHKAAIGVSEGVKVEKIKM